MVDKIKIYEVLRGLPGQRIPICRSQAGKTMSRLKIKSEIVEPGLEVDLPPRLRRHAAQPHPDGVGQRVLTCIRRRCGARGAHAFTWCMGGITFLMFLVTVVTGVYLMFYYRPTAEYAYADMKYLEFDMPFGMLMRNMHRWAAHGMVIAVWLHMFRVFLTGSYKPPREFNWVVGVILLVLTLLLSFTGYLLPWDQLSIWAVTVGSNMGRATPMLGHEGPFAEFVGVNRSTTRAPSSSAAARSAAHALCASTSCTASSSRWCEPLAVHFWRIRRDGFWGRRGHPRRATAGFRCALICLYWRCRQAAPRMSLTDKRPALRAMSGEATTASRAPGRRQGPHLAAPGARGVPGS